MTHFSTPNVPLMTPLVKYMYYCYLPHSIDVALISLYFFLTESEPAEGDIRLEDGNSSSKGRVEIYHNSTWGFIYQIHWSYIDNTAEVACRQLGLDTTNVRGFVMNRGNGSLHTFGAVHSCVGSENRIDACLVLGESVSSTKTVLAVECGKNTFLLVALVANPCRSNIAFIG